jgi:hypothetical protein
MLSYPQSDKTRLNKSKEIYSALAFLWLATAFKFPPFLFGSLFLSHTGAHHT